MIDEDLGDRSTIDVDGFPYYCDMPLMEEFIKALGGFQSTDLGALSGIETLNANALRAIGKGVAVDKMYPGRIQQLLPLRQKTTRVSTRYAPSYRSLRIRSV